MCTFASFSGGFSISYLFLPSVRGVNRWETDDAADKESKTDIERLSSTGAAHNNNIRYLLGLPLFTRVLSARVAHIAKVFENTFDGLQEPVANISRVGPESLDRTTTEIERVFSP